MDELAPGLRRFAARHPDWRPSPVGSPGDWDPVVGSVLYDAPDAVVFVDPLVPDELWPELDAHVRERGVPVVVLTTLGWHRRSRDEVAKRYGASTSRARRSLPAGVEPVRIRGAGETMFWLPEHRALIPGDRLLGDGEGGLRLCHESWLRYLPSGITTRELRDALRPLLELPIERVVVSHGEPVLEHGREALARALR